MMPNGKAVRIAIIVVRKVPESNGRIPYRLLVNKGVHSVSKRNLPNGTSMKKPQDSDRSTQMIPRVVRTVISPLKASNFSMICSLNLFKLCLVNFFSLFWRNTQKLPIGPHFYFPATNVENFSDSFA